METNDREIEIKCDPPTVKEIQIDPPKNEITPNSDFSWGEIDLGETRETQEENEVEPEEEHDAEFDPAEVLELLNDGGLLDDLLAQGMNAAGDAIADGLKKAQHEGVDPETIRRYKVADALIKVIHYYAKTAPIDHPLTGLVLAVGMVGLAYATSPLKPEKIIADPIENLEAPEEAPSIDKITPETDEELAEELAGGW